MLVKVYDYSNESEPDIQPKCGPTEVPIIATLSLSVMPNVGDNLIFVVVDDDKFDDARGDREYTVFDRSFTFVDNELVDLVLLVK